MARIFSLQRTDEHLKFRQAAQVFQTRILQKERPARESGANAALKPFKRLFRLAQHSQDAANLVVAVVCVAESSRNNAGAVHRGQCTLMLARQSVKQSLKTQDERFVGQKTPSLIQTQSGLLPFACHHGYLWSEVKRVFIARQLGAPRADFLFRKVVFLPPDVNLGDAVANRPPRMERSAAAVHLGCMVQQSDVRQNRAKPVVSTRQVLLKRKRAAQFSNGLQVLKILGGTPQEHSSSQMRFG